MRRPLLAAALVVAAVGVGPAAHAAPATPVVVIRDSVLVVIGTDRADRIVIRPVGERLQVRIDGRRATVMPVAGLTGIRLVGRDGSDRLDVTVYDDLAVQLLGGPGDDLLASTSAGGRLSGGPGADTIEAAGDGTRVTGGDGDDSIELTGGPAVALGGPGDDRLTARFDDNRLEGGSGDDVIEGGIGPGTYLGGSGDDVLYGGIRDSSMAGGAGDDELHGGPGDATMTGGPGADRLLGGTGLSVMSGGADDDEIEGGTGRNLIHGGAGDDELNGGTSTSTIYGDAGDDRLDGGFGSSRLRGGAGDDRLRGAFGTQTLAGDTGDDQYDIGSGGQGRFTFVELPGEGRDTVSLAEGTYQPSGFDLSSTTPQRVSDDEVKVRLSAGDTFEDLIGSANPDRLIGTDTDNVLTGNAGDDVLTGAGGADAFGYADPGTGPGALGSDTTTDFDDPTDATGADTVRLTGLAPDPAGFGTSTIDLLAGAVVVATVFAPGHDWSAADFG